ncbi:glycosyltransferase family 39 protein [Aquisphaera insulae]|uniref:glycosyltransferase family 39 protein n=1 Tax=Aquisphaera insulae TaxID=2712864 RepID=UPI0013EAB207|nr:glycosyltransferase family 39 protein [Aquisphaera insulae]
MDNPEGRPGTGRWVAIATGVFLVLGILIRLTRYLVVYPIWHDEAFLAASLWDRSYVDLFRPLEYGQIAPWLFLVIERTAVDWLGYSEWSLRLFPTICSVAGMVVFGHLSGQLLTGKARLIAVAVFATAIFPIRHGAEIKPYAGDLLAALIVVSLALHAIKEPGRSRWWWIMAAASPVLIAVSYPVIFVLGGIAIATAPLVLRSPERSVRLGWLTTNLVVAAAFLSVYFACTQFQAAAMRDQYRTGCWADAFPPLDRPWMVPVWLVDVTSGVMMAYPAGDRHGGSTATLLCLIAGALCLARRGDRAALGVLLAPSALGLAAAFLGRYPFGGAQRVMLYLAPSICLLAGLGLADLIARIRIPRRQFAAIAGCTAALAILGVGLLVRDLARPYRVIEDARTREFARWVWSGQSPRGESACVKTDLGLSARPDLWRVGMSAVYLFHQRMFSERHRDRLPVDLDPSRYSADRPLRLVAFDELPEGEPGFDAWYAALLRSFEVRRRDSYEIQPGKPGEGWLRDAYVVLELVPRRDGASIAGKAPRPISRY